MNKSIARALTAQYIKCTNTAKHATIYFYMEKNPGLPESIVHVESSKSHHWWSHARREGFVFQKRLRPMSPREFYKCIKRVDLSDIYVCLNQDNEVICQNNHTRKFVLRCIQEFHRFYDTQDKSENVLS